MNRICVFCGSSSGVDVEYSNAAEKLGKVFVRNKIGLIYGGARVGLMGKIATIIHNSGGEIIGVIPRKLHEKEVAFTGLSDLRVVETMHERKALMAELSDGFIALPGGLGTMEEFFEVLTWAQLGFHNKPCGLLNINGYFDTMLRFLDHSVNEHFIYPEHRSMILVDDDPELLLEKFSTYQPPLIDKAERALRKIVDNEE